MWIATDRWSETARRRHRRALQIAIAILALLPIVAGAAGIVRGPAMFGATAPWPVQLDSQVRFLSGVLMAIGVGWWSCIPAIEAKTQRLRLLALVTFVGGLARLFSLAEAGVPTLGHRAGLAMELAVVPALVFWHWTIVRGALRK